MVERATPEPIEMWAIAVSGKWFDGCNFMHDNEKPWLFRTKEAAAEKAKQSYDYRKDRGWPLAKYKPIRVRISVASL